MSADKQYDRQFLAWAVDRALRFYEVNKKECTAEEVTSLAEKFCSWIMPAPDAEPDMSELSEDEKQANDLHDKHLADAGITKGNA